MNYAQEFKHFAIKDQGINGNYYDAIMTSMYPVGMTPNIIEEDRLKPLVRMFFLG